MELALLLGLFAVTSIVVYKKRKKPNKVSDSVVRIKASIYDGYVREAQDKFYGDNQGRGDIEVFVGEYVSAQVGSKHWIVIAG